MKYTLEAFNALNDRDKARHIYFTSKVHTVAEIMAVYNLTKEQIHDLYLKGDELK